MQFKCEQSSKNFGTSERRKYFYYLIVFYIYNTCLPYLQSLSLFYGITHIVNDYIYLIIVNYVLRSNPIDSKFDGYQTEWWQQFAEYLKSIEDFTANN